MFYTQVWSNLGHNHMTNLRTRVAKIGRLDDVRIRAHRNDDARPLVALDDVTFASNACPVCVP